MSNLTTLRADSLELWDDQAASYVSVLELVTGFPPTTMNTLELLAQALGNDPEFFESVSTNLETKANQGYVDAELDALDADLAQKSSLTYVDAQLGLRDTAIGTKADQASVDIDFEALDADLAEKSSLVYVNAQLGLRDTAISLKANQANVDADLEALDAGLAEKSSLAYVNTQLGLRDASISAKTSLSTTSALAARVTGVERVVTVEDGVSYNYLETGEDALVIRGANEISANFLGPSS